MTNYTDTVANFNELVRLCKGKHQFWLIYYPMTQEGYFPISIVIEKSPEESYYIVVFSPTLEDVIAAALMQLQGQCFEKRIDGNPAFN